MSTNTLIYKVALPVPLPRLFDYLPSQQTSQQLARGTRVKVPFGRQERVGIILDYAMHSSLKREQLKSISSICDPFPLFPETLCDFIIKAARYYHHAIGEVAFTGLPPPLRQGKPFKSLESEQKSSFSQSLALNAEQHIAVNTILQYSNQFQPFLLEGITGSGKTEVYLQVAAEVLKAQKQILVLVPEISLTPQTLKRFQTRFNCQVYAYHSRITASKRTQVWQRVRNNEPIVVIGTRSAIFLPFINSGLIIIDEEHDPSFKQQDSFRYSARDLAVLRAQQSNCPIILGSATPAFETLSNVMSGKYKKLSLPHRVTSCTLPQMSLIDVRHKKLESGLSSQLIAKMRYHFERQGQVLLFINRRGYSPTLMCYDCGWIAECSHCDARLTYHHKRKLLICHHCLHQRKVPSHCSSCEAQALHPIGQGTERIEETLTKIFPHLKIARIDSDATRQKGNLDLLLSLAEKNEARLLIGTQMLAKGHHFPHLSLVGIVDADSGLLSTDFRAIERMAQLIIQVAGRAGRVHQAGEVMIQTFHPDHPLLQQMLKQDYTELAQQLLEERRECQLPPFSHWALLRAESLQSAHSEKFLQDLQKQLITKSRSVKILGPIPAPMSKRQGHYRFQLLLQSQDRKSLHDVLSYSTDLLEENKFSKKVRWSLDVDPIEIF